ncbi:hypothetical protein HK103_004654 [Boothiomyces macroporosus]|uniref:SAP domain-containing protein n=1 Tax=Boothiomyces macroporosus TaxID=261099 RepID=A0AAD5Y655_9FUNG|nr:hypothetical protein HK103_004654 [Boothiomyces macroporosus]
MLKHLSQLKKPELIRNCVQFGLPITGTRQVLIDNIVNACDQVVVPKDIIAMDIGTSNLGYIHLETSSKNIIDWKLIDPQFPKGFDIAAYSTILNKLIPKNNVQYVIEKQSYRLGTRIPYAILKTNAIEAILSGLFVNQVESIPPQMVSKYFELPKSDYKLKKKKSIELVASLIEKGELSVGKHALETFQLSKKKDDLSDCFLIAYAYYQWKLKLLNFRNRFNK